MKTYSVWMMAAAGALALPILAQEPGRERPRAPSLRVDAAFTASADLEARGAPAGGMAVARTGVSAELPLPALDSGTWPTLGFRYQEHRLDREAGAPLPDRLKSLSLNLAVAHRLGEEWTLIGAVSPGFSEAGSGFSSAGLHVGVFALANRRISPALTAGIGFAYDSLSRGGSGRVIPVAGLDWAPADGWRVTLGYPRAGLAYEFTPDLTFEFKVEADFASYRVNDDPGGGPAGRPALDRTVVEYEGLLVGPAVAWRAAPGFTARISAGLAPRVSAEYRRRGYELKATDTVGYVSAEAGYRF
ncbi:MAG: hypothetical protein JNG83_02975 [Opitutaceae bacterium]|nr:hypothetical protein [Opitutaceae bacterium]